MDVTTQMKEAITKLQDTQLQTNFLLADNLQKLLNKYTSSKLKSLLQKQADLTDTSKEDSNTNHQENKSYTFGPLNFNEKDSCSLGENKDINHDIKEIRPTLNDISDTLNSVTSKNDYDQGHSLVSKYGSPKIENIEDMEQTAIENYYIQNPINLDAFNCRSEGFEIWDYLEQEQSKVKKETCTDIPIKTELQISMKNNTISSKIEEETMIQDKAEIEGRLTEFKSKPAYENIEIREVSKECESKENLIKSRKSKSKNKLKESNRNSKVRDESKKCEFCPFTPIMNYYQERTLRVHKRRKHFICLVCEHQAFSKLDLADHYSKEHQEDTVSKNCEFCSFAPIMNNDQERTLRLHKRKVHFVCIICENKSLSKIELSSHYSKQHQQEEGYLRCNIDGCLFRAKIEVNEVKNKRNRHRRLPSYLFVHMKTIHNGVYVRCDQCDSKHRDTYKLKKHKAIHHSDLPRPTNECKTCGKQILLSHMIKHNKIHGVRPSLFCSQCKFTTKDRYYMTDHERSHLEGHIKCEKCEFSCKTKNYMKTHIKFKHEGEAYMCSICNHKSSTSSHMRAHEETHNKRTLECTTCDYKGTTNLLLKVHMLRHADPKYMCEECDYKTHDRANFTVHKTVKHGNVILKCLTCGYETKAKRSLEQHKKKNNHD